MMRNNRIQLSDHFTYKKLFRFVLAPICTMLFTSIYGIVDGFFVSNYVGNTAFASAFFTALSNGKISAILSVTRTLILQLVMIYVLPMLLYVDGLWAAVIAVEGISLIVTVYYILKNRRTYGYMKSTHIML